MQRVLVTGGAGFVGTSLVEDLVAGGGRVTVVDRLPTDRQHRNARDLVGAELVPAELGDLDLVGLLDGHDAVVHLAATPGVQDSWADGFGAHVDDNLRVTQRLLEAALHADVGRIVLASSSSVYGDVPSGLATEDRPFAPMSPYGSTKAAMELLAGAYVARGVDVVSLRYFTVFGRRQRPDMAIARLLTAALGGPAFPLRGDGTQVRDLTHVDDVVSATVAALTADLVPGTALNVGGGTPVSLREVIATVGEVTGTSVPVRHVPPAPGDPRRTASDTTRARTLLDWRPRVDLATGIADQLAHVATPTAHVA